MMFFSKGVNSEGTHPCLGEFLIKSTQMDRAGENPKQNGMS